MGAIGRCFASHNITGISRMVGALSKPSTIVWDNVTIVYRKHVALSQACGSIKPGSLTAVIGPNGGGKTTFVRAIMGQVPIKSGYIKFQDGKKLIPAYLPQKSSLDATFPMTLREVIGMGLCSQIGAFRAFSSEAHKKIAQVIQDAGLTGLEKRFAADLSGGQFQRMLFARLMLQEKPIIILDEPFVGIDSKTRKKLVQLILKWHTQGKTIIVVLHELNLVRQYFPDVVLVGRKIVGWGKTDQVLTHENMELAFQNLLEI